MKFTDFCNEIVNNIYIFKKDDLDTLKKSLTIEDMKKLSTLLENALDGGPRSVIEKKNLPPSGDVHDYMSISIYHWPNPNTSNGLPYIERDGVDNPESIHGDKEALRRLAYITYLAAILFYITGKENYLKILIEHNEVWFLNEKTKMNPNLKFAQHIPGVNTGEPGGVIDYAACYGYALNILNILRCESILPDLFVKGMQGWHIEFYEWLTTDSTAMIMETRENNQGSLYDLLLLNILRFLDRAEEHALLFKKKLESRIETQINYEGLLPQELKRTKSKSYTTMGLKMLLESAYLLLDYNVTLLKNYKLHQVYRYVYPHYINNTWDFIQIKEFDPYRGYYILFLFKKVLGLDFNIILEIKPNHWGYIFLQKLI